MSSPLFSILIPALTFRDWIPLYNHLISLTQPYGNLVEVLVDLDDGRLTSGVKRQRLVNRCKGVYISFVDDDDWVSNDYVSEIMRAIMDGPDVIGFDLSLSSTVKSHRQDEVWQMGDWGYDRPNGRMPVNQLCAWKYSLARRVGWCPHLGYGDDQLWTQSIRTIHPIIEVTRINRVLYYYRFCPEGTVNQSGIKVDAAKVYFDDGLNLYRDMRYSSDSQAAYVTQAGAQNLSVKESVHVYNYEGVITSLPKKVLQPVTTIKLLGVE